MYEKGKQQGTVKFTVKGGRDVRAVAVAGDFNKWKPAAMRREKDGAFSATLRILPGRHEYKFILDGDWVHDTDNADTVMNCHGTFNSVLAL